MELIKHDDCLWLAHFPEPIRRHLTSIPLDQKITFLINGVPTDWQKMRAGKDGRPTPGLTVVGNKAAWAKIQKGSKFAFEIPDAVSLSPLEGACVSPDHPELVTLIQNLKQYARRYKELTGRPLGITGEIAEYEAARAMGATLCPPREAGYDAFLSDSGCKIRIQIKGRSLTDFKKGRLGSIKLDHEWDFLWFATLNDALELVSIHEADRATVAKALTRTLAKARKAGRLSIREFRRIGHQVWPRATSASVS